MILFGLRGTHVYSGNFVPAVKYTDQLRGYATSLKKILSNLNFSQTKCFSFYNHSCIRV